MDFFFCPFCPFCDQTESQEFSLLSALTLQSVFLTSALHLPHLSCSQSLAPEPKTSGSPGNPPEMQIISTPYPQPEPKPWGWYQQCVF